MDDDIISQGGERDPSPWPRRLTVIAALVVVMAGGGAYLTRSIVSHPPVVTARPTPAGSTAADLTPEPDRIAGQTVSWDWPALCSVGAGKGNCRSRSYSK